MYFMYTLLTHTNVSSLNQKELLGFGTPTPASFARAGGSINYDACMKKLCFMHQLERPKMTKNNIIARN